MAFDPYHRQRPPVHEALVGAGVADRLRAHVHSPGGGFPGRSGHKQTGWPDVPRWPGDGPGDRCGVEVGANRQLGAGVIAVLAALPLLAATLDLRQAVIVASPKEKIAATVLVEEI